MAVLLWLHGLSSCHMLEGDPFAKHCEEAYLGEVA